MREDAPISVKGWNPENYSREYFGPVTLTKALSLSLNTVAVRLGLEVGPKTVVPTAHRLGITSELEPNATIALGTSDGDAARNGFGLRGASPTAASASSRTSSPGSAPPTASSFIRGATPASAASSNRNMWR